MPTHKNSLEVSESLSFDGTPHTPSKVINRAPYRRRQHFPSDSGKDDVSCYANHLTCYGRVCDGLRLSEPR